MSHKTVRVYNAPRPRAQGTRVYKYRDVRYVSRHKRAPATFKDPVTCLTCHRVWEDGVSTAITPTPAARCPFEHMHTKKEMM